MALRDLSVIEKENVRRVVAPFPVDAIKEFFENKKLFFVVNYKDSKIKGNMFLTYLSNLDLPFEVDFTNASIEERFEIIKNYMETKTIHQSDTLRLTVADILVTFRGNKDGLNLHNPILNESEKQDFIAANLELIKKWDLFISSTMVYMIKAFPDLNEILKVDTIYKVMDDINYIGLNVVNLFGIPSFSEIFFAEKLNPELYYFKPQFEEYMFKGQSLYHYFACEENTLFLTLSALIRRDIPVEEFIQYIQSEEVVE